jgi:putative ABC transport system permease protein
LPTILQDFRFALRILIKNPGFSLIAILSLALGIGANAAIFSLADALFLRPLPILEPSAVLNISTNTPDNPFTTGSNVSYPNYRDLRDKSHSFESMTAFQLTTLSVAPSARDLPKVRTGVLASDSFFQTLGIQPFLGRTFLPEEGKVPGRDAVVVVGYDFWQNDLAHDPNVVGRSLRIKGIDFTIVGVTPKTFNAIDQFFTPALYVPVMMSQRLDAATEDPTEIRSDHFYSVKGRLKPGVSRETAQADLAAVWSGLQQTYKQENEGRTIAAQTELQARMKRSPPDTALVALLMSLVGVVLLIACANVASLLLGRARARSREIALRISLGATKIRLVRQMLSESLLLALSGAAMGLWIGYAGISYLQSIPIPSEPPISITPRMDTRVLLFSLAAAVVSAILFGLVPALRSLKTDLVPALKSATPGSTGSNRTTGRNILVVAQVALSMVLLAAAGMLLDGFRKLLILDPGFRTDHRLMLEFDTSLVRYSREQTRNFYRQLADQARNISGVRSVTVSRSIPYTPNQYMASVVPEGYQFPKNQTSDSLFANIVDEHYFDTMDTAVIRGRGITADDKDGTRRVAIVNEEFAKSYWPNQEPLGKRFHLNNASGPWIEVVGVTKTGKYLFVGETPLKFVYLPFAQNPSNEMLLLVRTTGSPATIAGPVRAIVQGLDSNQPVFNVRTLDDFYQQRAVAVPMMIITLVTTMGLVGLILALVGLYGLIAYSVSRRTREIGIRIAVGADRSQVLKMVIRQGLALALTGVAIGGVATFGAARVIAVGLVGLGNVSPATFIAVPALLLGVTLAACYIPARRASQIDPITALRYE